MKSIKTIMLILASISFITVIGGAIYEHVAAIPVWKLAPPVSLTMFQGEYGITPFHFWKAIHPVTMLLLIVSLIANWKSDRRKLIIVTIVGYAIVLVITFTYFVPNLLDIIETPSDVLASESLATRAATWEALSLVRLACIIGLAIALLFSLTKGNELSKTQLSLNDQKRIS